MILTVDIGNTNIVAACFRGSALVLEERLSTNRTKTGLEYAIDLKNVLEIHHIDPKEIHGSIYSSVVPPINEPMASAIRMITGTTPLAVGPGVKNGLKIKLDNPAQLGADRAADAVAAIAQYPVPLAIIDMGTATTISVIDKDKNYLGGMIMPGVMTSLDALITGTSLLPKISMDVPEKVIGTNTTDCMKSGIIRGSAAAVDGLLDRIEEELGTPVTAIATGGMSHTIVKHCRRHVIHDPSLLSKGLKIIYDKNR